MSLPFPQFVPLQGLAASSFSIAERNTALFDINGIAYPSRIKHKDGGLFGSSLWTYDSMYQSRPAYKSGPQTTMYWSTNRWYIYDAAYGTAYQSFDDVASPELITTWEVGADGAPPVPVLDYVVDDRELIDAVVAPVIVSSASPVLTWATNGSELYCEIAYSSIDNVYGPKISLTCNDLLQFIATLSGYYFVRYRFRSKYVSRWSEPVEVKV